MSSSDLWTDSQLQAWSFIQSGLTDELNQSEALREYRAGGGAIRTSSWGELWHRAEDAFTAWNTLYQFNSTDTIPQSMFLDTNINFRGEYTYNVTLDVRNLDGSITNEISRYISSDRLITVQELYNGIDEAMSDDPSNPSVEVLQVRSIQMYHKIR
jgi:hypothetical protein